MYREFAARALCTVAVVATVASPGVAQDGHEHEHDSQPMDHSMHAGMSSPGWHVMQDGLLTGFLNAQGGPRGETEVKTVNWWMGMFSRDVGRDRFTFNAMLSLDPATVGRRGYAELFQAGEALDGRPVVDRQHPHDFLMQVSASWRMPIGEGTSLTISGGPAGSPALGPVAFMHRPSAEAIVMAPLSHHTFDSTHISFGVATAAIDRGRWTLEASAFNAHEPDDDRWDLDLGRLNSVSGRIWYRPAPEWSVQVSSGHLVEPEALEAGDITRSTVSVSWLRLGDDTMRAATVGVGVNATDHGRRRAVFGELARQSGRYTLSGRAEWVEAETALLQTGMVPVDETHDGAHGISEVGQAQKDAVGALTLAALRRLGGWKGIEGAVGANLTLYAVPDALRSTHGSHPASLVAFVQIRPLTGVRGRMWNMR